MTSSPRETRWVFGKSLHRGLPNVSISPLEKCEYCLGCRSIDGCMRCVRGMALFLSWTGVSGPGYFAAVCWNFHKYDCGSSFAGWREVWLSCMPHYMAACSCQSTSTKDTSKGIMAGQRTQQQLLTSSGSAKTSSKAHSIHSVTGQQLLVILLSPSLVGIANTAL